MNVTTDMTNNWAIKEHKVKLWCANLIWFVKVQTTGIDRSPMWATESSES